MKGPPRFQAAAVSVVEPAVIDAPQPAIFRAPVRQVGPSMRAVNCEQARLACSQKDFDGAVKEMKLALSGAPDPQKPGIESLVKRLEAKEDINK